MSAEATYAPSAPEIPSSSAQDDASVEDISAESSSTSSTSAMDWQYFDNSVDNKTKPSTQDASEATDATVSADASTTTSSTAYAFAGSALGSESTTEKLKAESGKNKSEAKVKEEEEEKNDDSMYECNICLDTAKDAVVSMCGHLFCWPCLHQWLETRPNRKLCPVCKAAIGKDKVIPLYGRNSAKQEDPRNKVPPRPAGQRIEPEPQQGFQGFGFGDGFHMSFGIGAFPFGYFASSFNFGEPRPAAANRGTTQFEDEQQLSKLFLYLAFLCIAWLLFA